MIVLFFFRIKILFATFASYERGISKINSCTKGVLDKKELKLGFVIETTKKFDFLRDMPEDPLVTCEQQDRIEDLRSSNMSRALVMLFYLL